jgi:methionine-rich copper-binding protein CopC
MKKMSRLLWLFAAAPLFAVSPAFAHAILITSAPGSDQTIAARPAVIVLRYNSRIDQHRSLVTLAGPTQNKPLPLSVEQGAPVNELHVAPPASMPPGSYVLRWQVLATDGHITRGDVPFVLGPTH